MDKFLRKQPEVFSQQTQPFDSVMNNLEKNIQSVNDFGFPFPEELEISSQDFKLISTTIVEALREFKTELTQRLLDSGDNLKQFLPESFNELQYFFGEINKVLITDFKKTKFKVCNKTSHQQELISTTMTHERESDAIVLGFNFQPTDKAESRAKINIHDYVLDKDIYSLRFDYSKDPTTVEYGVFIDINTESTDKILINEFNKNQNKGTHFKSEVLTKLINDQGQTFENIVRVIKTILMTVPDGSDQEYLMHTLLLRLQNKYQK